MAPSFAQAVATLRCGGKGRRVQIAGMRPSRRGERLKARFPLAYRRVPLESRSAFAEVLIPPDRRKGITLQYVTRVQVASEPILELADRLDRLLKDLFPPQKQLGD